MSQAWGNIDHIFDMLIYWPCCIFVVCYITSICFMFSVLWSCQRNSLSTQHWLACWMPKITPLEERQGIWQITERNPFFFCSEIVLENKFVRNHIWFRSSRNMWNKKKSKVSSVRMLVWWFGQTFWKSMICLPYVKQISVKSFLTFSAPFFALQIKFVIKFVC